MAGDFIKGVSDDYAQSFNNKKSEIQIREAAEQQAIQDLFKERRASGEIGDGDLKDLPSLMKQLAIDTDNPDQASVYDNAIATRNQARAKQESEAMSELLTWKKAGATPEMLEGMAANYGLQDRLPDILGMKSQPELKVVGGSIVEMGPDGVREVYSSKKEGGGPKEKYFNLGGARYRQNPDGTASVVIPAKPKEPSLSERYMAQSLGIDLGQNIAPTNPTVSQGTIQAPKDTTVVTVRRKQNSGVAQR